MEESGSRYCFLTVLTCSATCSQSSNPLSSLNALSPRAKRVRAVSTARDELIAAAHASAAELLGASHQTSLRWRKPFELMLIDGRPSCTR